MTQPAYNVTGPVHIYFASNQTTTSSPTSAAEFNAGSGTNAQYLGTCEIMPEPQEEFNWKDVFNSLGGDMVPADRMYMGLDGLVVMNLNRFSYTNLFGLIGGGSESHLNRGSLMVNNRFSLQLWCAFDFFGTLNALAYPEMPPGYFWWCTEIRRHWPQRLTIDTTNVLLIFQAQQVYNKVTRGWDMRSSNPAFFSNLPAPN